MNTNSKTEKEGLFFFKVFRASYEDCKEIWIQILFQI